MSMVEVKTSELIGASLDYAVAVAQGWQMLRVPKDIDGNHGGEVLAPQDISRDFQFSPRGQVPVGYFLRRWSTDWSQGGPLIDLHQIEVSVCEDTDIVHASMFCWRSYGKSHRTRWSSGETHLIAACRAIVAAKLGETVNVPTELL